MAQHKKDDIQQLLDQIQTFKTIIEVAGDPADIKGMSALEMVVRVKKMNAALEELKGKFLREANKAWEELTILKPMEKKHGLLGATLMQYSKTAVWNYPHTPVLVKLAREVEEAEARLSNAQEEARKNQTAKKETPAVNKDTDQMFKVTL